MNREYVRMLYKSLGVNLPTIRHAVFVTERIQLHKLSISVLKRLGSIGRHSVMFQVVDPKRCSTNPPPGVMRSFPSLPTEEGLTALSGWMFVFYKLTEIGPDQIIACVDIKLPQQEVRSPIRILDVEHSKSCFPFAVLLVPCQIRAAYLVPAKHLYIRVYSLEFIQITDFLRRNFPHVLLATIYPYN